MKNVRVIPKLEVKGPNLIKGIHMEGLRIVGHPEEAALRYYQQGADELIYMDLVASLYQRSYLREIVERTADQIFIPLTVGGGIRTMEDIRALLRAGADKVSINTAAINNPEFVREAARSFGSQCIVVSIEAKRKGEMKWEAYTDCGRQPTGVDVFEWAKRSAELGAGEILLTSIDRDGTFRGYDIELIQAVAHLVPVPVIACGGAGTPQHVADAVLKGSADAVAAAAMLHFNKASIPEVKSCLASHGIGVRMVETAVAV
jgi:cyclase